MRTHRILSLLLAAVLALLPGFAQGTSEQALQEQVDALVAQIAELQQQDPTFVYDGETYHVSDGTQYANEHLKQTDDYYPFFDKLMEASLRIVIKSQSCTFRRCVCSISWPFSGAMTIT